MYVVYYKSGQISTPCIYFFKNIATKKQSAAKLTVLQHFEKAVLSEKNYSLTTAILIPAMVTLASRASLI